MRYEEITMGEKQYKIVYCTPALYMAGGVERVLTLKANYFAEYYGYDITIILTEGKEKPLFYPLSDKIKVINLDINFEELWTCSIIKKVFVYLKKQRIYKKKLSEELMRLRPDITISLLRREINFINDIQDGSKKIGELHINRSHYRNFEGKESSPLKKVFSKLWMKSLVTKLKRLDSFVVLTEKDREAWTELDNVNVIPNPLSFIPTQKSALTEKRVIAVGRYCHEKGYDDLLQAWKLIEQSCQDWRLEIYGDGNRIPYEQLINELQIDCNRCILHGRTKDIEQEYINSSFAVCSSRFEGFGLTIIEAMACGLPVVSFDCPWGPQSIIENNENGILVENGNIEKLANSIMMLMNDGGQRLKMGDNAIKSVNRFRIENIAQKWLSLFCGI